MRITVVGAGAMGGSYGGLLAAAGHEVDLIDIQEDHVAAIDANGMRVEGVCGEHVVRLPAATVPAAGARADAVIVFVDANNTRAAAETVAQILTADGFAITFQNGIGNVETLAEVLGRERVLAGSSMCSAASLGPGRVSLTHMGLTSVGETAGGGSARASALVQALVGAGLEAEIAPDITARIWEKFVVNCAGNAIAATTGLRAGEFLRVPELDAFQSHVLDEVMAVLNAKNIHLPDPDIVTRIKTGARKKFNRPSMLQHVTLGRKTEIDALNGALVRAAAPFAIPVPYNESLVALLKGRELARMREVHEPDLDYDAWEARIAAGLED